MRFRLLPSLFALVLSSTPLASVQAQGLSVAFELPQLSVVEYHRPYIALWIAQPDNQLARNLAVLYDIRMADNEGQKWLKDLRQWWRRSGRTLTMPVDGISGATRTPGRHQLNFDEQIADLPQGDYQLMVEVVRELGGRELLSIPFSWPVPETLTVTAAGEDEIGQLELVLSP